ncbi:MAG: bifunctional diaminohydroxyphosphoribosylaminopyrimidine deaminase/5-amino-6-(5-phosphoribosylamino)uracil reductase RibD, partial [Gammaproteobacteria bacterium]
GEGWHVRAGDDHAEIIALQQAGKHARGATCYVTLEPCAHTGKTPPCTDALIASGINRVLMAMTDPNPLVDGKGLLALEQCGLEVASGLLEIQARSLNPGYIKRMNTGMPYVRCKMATSIDGKIALANGESKWITGEHARKDVQRLRARSCALLTGSGTILADDPRLTVRDMDMDGRPPLRVVFDRRLRCPSDATIFQYPGRIIIVTDNDDAVNQARLEEKGAEIVRIRDQNFLRAALAYLTQTEGVNEVLVETGPGLAGSLIREGLVDELLIYQAPVLLGSSAISLFDLPEISQMYDRTELTLVEVRKIGNDLRMTYIFEHS